MIPRTWPLGISPSTWLLSSVILLSSSIIVPILWQSPHIEEPGYQIQVFSQDPMILYVHDFLSKDEITHLLKLGEGNYEVSRLWPDAIGFVDENIRVSESAELSRKDAVVRRVEARARRMMGWRNNDTFVQESKLQRYGVNGFYHFHYDWVHDTGEGNRMTTLMVYVVDKCTGGGTNFPRLEPPTDRRWCEVIECGVVDEDGESYPGVTFKPIAGSAIYWENFHPNGTAHRGTRHAALPVASGEKVGYNIWSWDNSWKEPVP